MIRPTRWERTWHSPARTRTVRLASALPLWAVAAVAAAVLVAALAAAVALWSLQGGPLWSATAVAAGALLAAAAVLALADVENSLDVDLR